MKAFQPTLPVQPSAPMEAAVDMDELLNPVTTEDPWTEEEKQQALQKRDYVYAVERMKADTGVTLEVAAGMVATEAEKSGAYSLLYKAGKNGTSALTYYNFRSWRKKLGKANRKTDFDNWPALCPQYRGSRGNYTLPGDIRFWHFLYSVVLRQNRIPLRTAYRRCRTVYLQAFDDDSQIPTYDQVVYAHRKLDNKITLISQMEQRKFALTYCTYNDREAPPPGMVWVGDNRTLDLWVQYTDSDGNLASARPYLTLWCDWGSYSPAGWLIRIQPPDIEAQVLSLRHGVRRNGNTPPMGLYVDNGSDYKADEVQRVVASLGCHNAHCLPYNPPAKIVERYFADVADGVDKWFKSYCGLAPHARPEYVETFRREYPHRLPTVDQVLAEFEAFVEEKDHLPSRGKICGGKTPVEMRAQAQRLRLPLDESEMREAFLAYAGTRQIHKGGEVHVLGRKYIAENLFTRYQNDDAVVVKIDRDDVSRVYCYDFDGRKICEAREKTVIAGMRQLMCRDEEAERQTLNDIKQGQRLKSKQAKNLRKAVATLQGRTNAATTVRSLPPLTISDSTSTRAPSPPMSEHQRSSYVDTTAPSPAGAGHGQGVESSRSDVELLDALLSSDSQQEPEEVHEYAGIFDDDFEEML